MRIITGVLIATTMMILAGCSTTAENPNYQQTTRYKGSNPYTDKAVVQQANYQTQAPAPITYQANSDPAMVQQSAPTYQAVPQAVTYEAPRAEQGLQENTTSLGENGTPGYYAVNGIEPPAQETPQATKPQYAQIQLLQPQQIQPEPIPMPTTFTSVPTPADTMRYLVVPGDTLYSLARTTCSTVTEIQNLNTINDEFYIRAGEDILVPRGRCAE